jgi:ABC-2 type transport system permease protein
MGILGVALALNHPHWTAARVAMLIVAPIAGAAVFSAIFVATASIAFWLIESGEIANVVTYGGRDFTTYPTVVYSGWFRRIFGYALGLGFVAYYPALFILGLPDPIGLPPWAGWIAPMAALPAMGAAALVWRTGVRHYRSTGS